MRVLIADDEPLARERLRRLLSELEDCEVVGEAANGSAAIEQNEQLQPDVILLDIRMPGMDGIEAAAHITSTERPPAVIFCTAYEEYAIAAFESRAVGYLLKPVQRDKLLRALRAARGLTRYQLTQLQEAMRAERRFLSSRTAGGTRLVPVNEVRLLMAEQKYVSAYYPGGTLLLDESLRELEAQFPGRFLRIHRNALVALEHVGGILGRGAGEYFVRLDGIDLKPRISRRHLAEVRRALDRL
jgi:two-component system response regulator AlgR